MCAKSNNERENSKVFAAGTGGSGNSQPSKTDSETASDPVIADLQGTWTTECYVFEDKSQTATWEISESQFTYTSNTFKDTTCTEKLQRLIFERILKVGNEMSTKGEFEVDMLIVDQKVAIDDPELLAQYQGVSAYAYTDWELGAAKSVSGRSYTPDQAAKEAPGDTFYTIMKVSGRFLNVGDPSTGKADSPVTRPKSFSRFFFTKQL